MRLGLAGLYLLSICGFELLVRDGTESFYQLESLIRWIVSGQESGEGSWEVEQVFLLEECSAEALLIVWWHNSATADRELG